MNPAPEQPWEPLFPPPQAGAQAVRLPMRLVRRHGRPQLLLPPQATAARQALSLYPAQSWKAKLARAALRWSQTLGLRLGTEACDVSFDAGSRFARFLCPPGINPAGLSFALLLGNPNVAGRRFVSLIFDRDGQPTHIVKAGAGAKAGALIRREREFIRQQTALRLHAPAMLGEFDGENVAAVALEYADGPTPPLGTLGLGPEILEGWLDPAHTASFSTFAVAAQLAAHCPPDAATRRRLDQLNQINCHPAIHHGDFVPWNIRVNPVTGRWRVLDWERGDSCGPPAWDWFHFVIQPLALVRHAAPATILAQVEALRRQPDFLRYAAQAGIENHFDLLLLGYLLTCRDVIRQTEGMPTIESLVKLVSQRLA